jgi:hypothetical protein
MVTKGSKRAVFPEMDGGVLFEIQVGLNKRATRCYQSVARYCRMSDSIGDLIGSAI